MEAGDILWACTWFIVGLFTFKLTSLKSTLSTISVLITAISLVAIIGKPDNLIQFFADYPISYVGGTITHLVYLIGANFVRGKQFHTRVKWERITVYAVIIVLLLIVFY